jgi:HK97 family phage major capsid protein
LAEKVAQKTAEQTGGPALIHSTKKKDNTPLWLKQAVVEFVAHNTRQSKDQVIEDRYPEDRALKAVMPSVTKTAVGPAVTFNTGWAQELVQQDIRGFLDVLTPLSAAAALASRATTLDFGGFDSIKIPMRVARATGNTLGGAFVGEAGAIPLGRIAVSSKTLSRYKMAVISTFTRELAERSTPAIEAVIRQAILDDTAIELDTAMFDANTAVAGVRPDGLLNAGAGAGTVTPTPGGGPDAVIGDIQLMLSAMVTAGVGSRPVLFLNSQDAMSVGMMQTPLGEMMFATDLAAGRVLGVEVVKSLNMKKGTAILVDASNVAIGIDPTMFSASDVATVVEASADGTAPTMAGDGTKTAGKPGDLGTPGEVPQDGGIPVSGRNAGTAISTKPEVRSLWQTYSVGIRAVTPVSWAVMRPGSVQSTTGTLTW